MYSPDNQLLRYMIRYHVGRSSLPQISSPFTLLGFGDSISEDMSDKQSGTSSV